MLHMIPTQLCELAHVTKKACKTHLHPHASSLDVHVHDPIPVLVVNEGTADVVT